MKKIVLLMCCAALFACTSDEPEQEKGPVKVETIELNQTSMTLHVTEETRLRADIEPSNAANQNIKWTSSNPEVLQMDVEGADDATIDLLALAVGETIITAEAEDGALKATCVVTVAPTKAEGISFQKTSFDVTANDDKEDNLMLWFSPKWTTNKKVTFTSSDPSILTVDNDSLVIYDEIDNPMYGYVYVTVTGHKQGEVTVTGVSDEGGFTAECKVTVKYRVIFG